jgi:hypothetical protein
VGFGAVLSDFAVYVPPITAQVVPETCKTALRILSKHLVPSTSHEFIVTVIFKFDI